MLYYQELNIFLYSLEQAIINNNGIIYDKYVCDRLLATFFKKAFLNKLCDVQNSTISKTLI